MRLVTLVRKATLVRREPTAPQDLRDLLDTPDLVELKVTMAQLVLKEVRENAVWKDTPDPRETKGSKETPDFPDLKAAADSTDLKEPKDVPDPMVNPVLRDLLDPRVSTV